MQCHKILTEDGTRLQVDDKVGQMMEGVTVTLDAENVLVLGPICQT